MGKAIPSLAFFHIPLQEFEEVWNTQSCCGEKNDRVSCPVLNTGLFAMMVQNRAVKGIFVGHDHGNDYRGNLYGIELCYGRTTGLRMHQNSSFLLGARVIQLYEDRDEFDTWIRLENGIVAKANIHDPDK